MLTGVRILNTRPQYQAKAFTQRLQSLGATIIEFPLFNIVPLDFTFPPLPQYDIAIFVSQNAVSAFFSHPAYIPIAVQDEARRSEVERAERTGSYVSTRDELQQSLNLKSDGYSSWPSTCTPIAIGEATAEALRAYHLNPVIPKEAHSESLLTLLKAGDPSSLGMTGITRMTGRSILLVKGENGRPLIEKILTQRGANVTPCNVYQRQPIDYTSATIQTIWQEDKIDIILLTSEGAIARLLTLFGPQGESWIKKKPCLVIGDRLKRIAAQQGFQHLLKTSPHHIVEGLTRYTLGDTP